MWHERVLLWYIRKLLLCLHGWLLRERTKLYRYGDMFVFLLQSKTKFRCLVTRWIGYTCLPRLSQDIHEIDAETNTRLTPLKLNQSIQFYSHVCVFVCLFVRLFVQLRILSPRVKLAVWNFARRFIGIQHREMEISHFCKLCSPISPKSDELTSARATPFRM